MPDTTNPETDTLHRALAALQGLQDDSYQVRRVAVERGGVIHLEVHEAGQQRFFVYRGGELLELRAANDTKIPFLKKMHEPGVAAGYTVISYRPGRRAVFKSLSDEDELITKAYRKNHAGPAAEKYAIALSACQAGGFDIPELVSIDTDEDCLIIAGRKGRTPDITAEANRVWTTIGSCLRRFQQSQNADGLPRFGPARELEVLEERARRFLLCMPALPRRWQEGRDLLEKAAGVLPRPVMGLAHRDLHDGQFIVSDRTVSLLDFDLLCQADVALDAGNLLAHMRLRTLQGRTGHDKSALSDCSAAFLTALGREDEPGFASSLLFYQASTYYRLALIYAIRPRWAHLAEDLICEGMNCLTEFGKPGPES